MKEQMEALSNMLGLEGDKRIRDEAEFMYLVLMLQAYRQARGIHQMLYPQEWPQ